jgi:L-threonylcarbamoyladenylate synthase
MLVLKIGESKIEREAALRAAVLALKRGQVISFPTETVYGVGCDPRNVKVVKRIFELKGRKESKPLQLIAGSLAQAKKVVTIDAANAKVIKKFWPGPLTLLLPFKKGVKLAPKTHDKRINAIRVTSDSFLQELTRRYGYSIAATSANRSGKPPATSGRGVVKAFLKDPKPDLLLDFGAIPKRKPTTVARIDKDGGVHVLRQGAVRL